MGDENRCNKNVPACELGRRLNEAGEERFLAHVAVCAGHPCYEIVNPSDTAYLTAASHVLAVAACAVLSDGRYAVKRDDFTGPLFLLGGHDEWFQEHTEMACETYLKAHMADIATVLETVTLLNRRTSMNDIAGRANELARALRLLQPGVTARRG